MSSFLNLRPRTLYFLRLLDERTDSYFPYVKVGITERFSSSESTSSRREPPSDWLPR